MKISLNWLQEFINTDLDPQSIAALLTQSGLEVESVEQVESIPGGLKGIVIGEVISCQKHPDADKLSLTTVNIGTEIVPIVCGAPNVAAGQKVVVATVGATLYPNQGEPFVIKKAKIRGAESVGMICAEDEIGLGQSHAGIMVLDTILANGTPAAEYFNLKEDYVLEIGLTPNRADAASHWGVARDLRALLNKNLTLPSIAEFKVDNQSLPIVIKVENTTACPRYSGLTISNATVKDSPDWLKARLNAIGVRPINNVVDVTNYVLHELGQPLHAFDAESIVGQQVIVKNLPEGTPFTTLDEKERKLKAHDLMICNAQGGMCIAGVFGGISSGVSEKTKHVFLESAYFSADSIRKTAQHHGLKTDASFRFERGTDPEVTVFALKRAALLIKELTGGQISSDIIDLQAKTFKPFKVQVRYKNVHRLIGKIIESDRIKEILQLLDINITEETTDGFIALVPTYRVDVQREADIIEEILRIYGFSNIEVSERLSSDYLAAFEPNDIHKQQQKVSELLAANGYNEIMTNSLTKASYTDSIAGFDSSLNVEILNKLSEDLGVMRQSLLFTGLDVLSHNLNHKQKDLKVFEFGKVYAKVDGQYQEHKKLSLFISGSQQQENWRHAPKAVEFHDLASAVNKIIRKLSDINLVAEPGNHPYFESSLVLKKGEKTLVTMGKLHKKVLKLAEIRQEVYFADIQWEQLLRLSGKAVAYQEVSKFPEVRRDISLVLDKKVTFADISKIVARNENRLIREVNVFDVYEGDNLGKDKKAYALSFTLQDKEKTLTDGLIDKVMGKLMQVFETELNAVIRK